METPSHDCILLLFKLIYAAGKAKNNNTRSSVFHCLQTREETGKRSRVRTLPAIDLWQPWLHLKGKHAVIIIPIGQLGATGVLQQEQHAQAVHHSHRCQLSLHCQVPAYVKQNSLMCSAVTHIWFVFPKQNPFVCSAVTHIWSIFLKQNHLVCSAVTHIWFIFPKQNHLVCSAATHIWSIFLKQNLLVCSAATHTWSIFVKQNPLVCSAVRHTLKQNPLVCSAVTHTLKQNPLVCSAVTHTLKQNPLVCSAVTHTLKQNPLVCSAGTHCWPIFPEQNPLVCSAVTHTWKVTAAKLNFSLYKKSVTKESKQKTPFSLPYWLSLSDYHGWFVCCVGCSCRAYPIADFVLWFSLRSWA